MTQINYDHINKTITIINVSPQHQTIIDLFVNAHDLNNITEEEYYNLCNSLE